MPRPNLNGKAVTVYLPRDVKMALGNAAKGTQSSQSKLLEAAWRWFGQQTVDKWSRGERPMTEDRGTADAEN
jgi:hypothetical protein